MTTTPVSPHVAFAGRDLDAVTIDAQSMSHDELIKSVEGLIDGPAATALIRNLFPTPVEGEQEDEQEQEERATRSLLRVGRSLGYPLWQDEFGGHVRAVKYRGIVQFTEDGQISDLKEGARSSGSKQVTPFHNDGASAWVGQDVDVMALACVEPCPVGGDSIILDCYALYKAMLLEEPIALAHLMSPLPHIRPMDRLEEQSELLWRPVFAWERSTFRARINIARLPRSLEALQLDNSHLSRAFETLDRMTRREQFQRRVHLERGDCLVVDDRRIAHARTEFSSSHRKLLRMWLSRPSIAHTNFVHSIDMS